MNVEYPRRVRQGTRTSIRRFNLATVITAAVVAAGVLISQPSSDPADLSASARDLSDDAVTAVVEPTGFRAANVTRDLERPTVPQELAPVAPAIEPTPPPSFSFEIATHNVLGASHTSGKKGRKGYGGAATRMGYSVGLLNSYGVDVVGFQELQTSQYSMFRARMPGFAVYPGLAAGRPGVDNSIAWRTSMFDLVDSYTIGVPYFGGRIRPMPVIRLKEKETGREFWVANFHNPADTHGNAARWRGAATSIEINLINRLRQETELPVFITGDMNERESYFCRVTAATGIAAASGGGTGSPCQPPAGPNPVDWILATPDVKITEYHDVRSGIITRTSDHPLLVATALMED